MAVGSLCGYSTLEYEGGAGECKGCEYVVKKKAVSDWVWTGVWKEVLFSLCCMSKYGTRILSSAFELERELYVSFTWQEYR